MSSVDTHIGIRYTNEEIVGDTILLLQYNCPDEDCAFAGLGWPDLHRHVREAHRKKMCDLCTRNKKVFTHEHDMFTDKDLGVHMKSGDDKPGAIDQTGFRGHPLCSFCGSRFYDDDKLYEHCRNKHERCFICDRRDSRQPHYYVDYNSLEEHFQNDHFLCSDRECLEKKFVVFESEMDLKGHQLSEHGNTLSKDVRRDARMVDLSAFDLRPSYQEERRGGSRGGRGEREGRGRGRDPSSEPLPMSSAQPMRRDEVAFQRQMAIHSAQSISNRTFGGQLTQTRAPNPGPNGNGNANASRTANPPASQPLQPPPSRSTLEAMEHLSISDLSSLTPEERARLTRHGAAIERASNLVGNNAAKITCFRAAVSSYNRGATTAEQLIDAFFALFAETDSHALGTLVREVSELFEDRSRGDAVRRAWQNWRAVNEDYPSLPGLGGMRGATTASSGWASAAASPAVVRGTSGNAAAQAKASTRVLKLKNSTRRGSVPAAGPAILSVPGANSGGGGSRSGTPAAAAGSSSAFPALPGTASASTRSQPSWTGGAAAGSGAVSARVNTVPTPLITLGPGPARGGGGAAAPARKTGPAPSLRSQEAFPSLPAAPKPTTTMFGYGRGTVRRDWRNGSGTDTGFAWGAGSGGGASGANEAEAEAEQGQEGGGGKKGKGKKNKKQVLVQWG